MKFMFVTGSDFRCLVNIFVLVLLYCSKTHFDSKAARALLVDEIVLCSSVTVGIVI